MEQSLRFGQAAARALEQADGDDPLACESTDRFLHLAIAEFLSEFDGSVSNEDLQNAISETNEVFAEAYGAGAARLGLAGSSGLIVVMFLVLARVSAGRPKVLLVDRAAHKSVIGGLLASGFEVRWLQRDYFPEHDALAPISPELIKRELAACPEAAAVWLTSCTYDGFNAEVPEIADQCRSRGIPLIVDAAWCPAYGALSDAGFPPNAISLGASVVITSPHKKGLAPSQIAVALFNDEAMAKHFDAIADVGYQTTSPNFLLVGDAQFIFREIIAGYFTPPWRTTVLSAREFCAHVPTVLPGCRVIAPGDVGAASGDPGHILLHVGELGLIGSHLLPRLQERCVIAEKATKDTVLLLLGPHEAAAWRQHLGDMAAVIGACPRLTPAQLLAARAALAPPSQSPKIEMTVRAAMLAPSERVALQDATGRIATQLLAPYPPGSALLVPGERIQEQQLRYLAAVDTHGGHIAGIEGPFATADIAVVIE